MTATRRIEAPHHWWDRVIATDEEHRELLREATTMVLYVSVVEIAELAALPEQHFVFGRVTGPVGGELLAIIWGTAVGLAIVHWFAFGFAARELRGQGIRALDYQIGLAQLAGAVFVSALSSLPVLLVDDVHERELTGLVPAILIGLVCYAVGRSSGRGRLAAIIYGSVALTVGLLVAAVKSALAAH